MWGHSGGGFMTAAAMFGYPDFFKVGISESGNHDNAIYNRWWSEKHDGVRKSWARTARSRSSTTSTRTRTSRRT